MTMRRAVAVACCVAWALCWMAGCSSRAILIERVIVNNSTNGSVADVKVTHIPSRKFGGVNGILPGEALDVGLASGGEPLLSKQAVVQWREEDGEVISVTLEIPTDSSAPPGRPHQLVYTLLPDGRATVGVAAEW